MIYIGIDPALTHSGVSIYDGKKFTIHYYEIIKNNKTIKPHFHNTFEKNGNKIHINKTWVNINTIHYLKKKKYVADMMYNFIKKVIFQKLILKEKVNICIEDYAMSANSNHLIQTGYFIESLKSNIFEHIDNFKKDVNDELLICPILTWKSLVIGKTRGTSDELYSLTKEKLLSNNEFNEIMYYIIECRENKLIGNKNTYYDMIASLSLLYTHLNFKDTLQKRFKENSRFYK